MNQSCERCGERKTDAGDFSYCPACLACGDLRPSAESFPPLPLYMAKWVARQMFGRNSLPGGYLFLESAPGMGSSRLLRAVSRGEVDALSAPFLVYFDAGRPMHSCCGDFFDTILRSVHSLLPRYDAESRDVSVLCAVMAEALHRRDPKRKVLIVIDRLHDAPPELFSLLPAPETLPRDLFFLLSFDLGTQKREAFAARFQKITPAASSVLTHGDFFDTMLMKRTISRDMLHLNFKHRLTDGDMLIEHAMALTGGDWYGCTLLNELLKQNGTAFLQKLSREDDLAAVYFHDLQKRLGETDFVRVITLLATLVVCGVPIRPEFLPGLAGTEPNDLALLCRQRGLTAAFLRDGGLMLEPASERLLPLLERECPEVLRAVAERFRAAACGETKLRLTKDGRALLFSLFFPAMLRSGTPEQRDVLFTAQTLSAFRITVGKAQEDGSLGDDETEQIWKAELDAAKRIGNTAGMREGLTQLCVLYRRRENYPAAVHAMDELLKLAKSTGTDALILAEMQRRRAELLLRADKFRAALEGLGRAISCAEQAAVSDERTVLLAALLRRRGEIEKQHKLYLPMADDLDRSAELLQPLAGAGGELALTLLLRGQARLLRDDRDAALRDFSDAVVLASGAGERYILPLRDLYRERGHALFALNEPRKAAASFSNAIAITKRKDDDPFLLARLYAERGQAHEADNDTEHALADRSECIAVLSAPKLAGLRCAARLAEAFLLRAQLYDRLNRYDDELRDCTAGIDRLEPYLDGKNKAAASLCISVYRQRMDVCAKTGDHAQIAEDRRRVAQLNVLLV